MLVLLPGLGVEINGARRWLGAGPLQFQPSEIVKLALVLNAAAVIAARPKITSSCGSSPARCSARGRSRCC